MQATTPVRTLIKKCAKISIPVANTAQQRRILQFFHTQSGNVSVTRESFATPVDHQIQSARANKSTIKEGQK
ncbi:hypothetical protein BFP76_00400 [Amylibacter kogurei]|uniref:Uncharacterized protein n=1 Tax=Paramylibacter kogurei TaxID=1889778 RepID=A0A2G5K9D2_9RHOB|nr:hypothetical protein BFP76_00400 [Amylibacter kogurei]